VKESRPNCLQPSSHVAAHRLPPPP